MNKIDRRSFIGKGVAGLAGLTLVGAGGRLAAGSGILPENPFWVILPFLPVRSWTGSFWVKRD